MAKRSTSGTTRQSARTVTEKKEKKQKPPRLSEEEKMGKYGPKNREKCLGYKIKFKPLTETQEEYYNLIMNKRITFSTGVPGSGKSFVCLSAALELLKEDNEYKRILIVTPTVEAGNMQIGLLPGSKEEKIQSYLDTDYSTIKDILEINGNDPNEYFNDLLQKGLVNGDCVSFMRGKTIKNTIVIITEAENFNKQELWLLLSRIHPTSKYIINGDNRQQDRKDIKKDQQNGLQFAKDKLYGKCDSLGFCHFYRKDIVRDPLIQELMDLWFEGENIDDY